MYAFKGYKFYNHLQEIKEICVVKDAVTHEILTEYIIDGESIIKIDDIFMICKNIDVQIMEEDEKIWLLINQEKKDSDDVITTDESAEDDSAAAAAADDSTDADNKNNNKNYLLWENIQTHNHFELINERMDNIFRLEGEKNVLLSRL
jgi:hypothetical protein